MVCLFSDKIDAMGVVLVGFHFHIFTRVLGLS